MRNLNLLIISALGAVTLGCSVLPLKADIKENHFRFENFKRDKGFDLEKVYLMCRHKRPIGWTEPKQYEAGEHNLWVRAAMSNTSFKDSTKEAIVNFHVNLDSNKSYMLNREVKEDKVALWIQEVDTGIIVSNIVSSELKKPLLTNYPKRRDLCEQGTV